MWPPVTSWQNIDRPVNLDESAQPGKPAEKTASAKPALVRTPTTARDRGDARTVEDRPDRYGGTSLVVRSSQRLALAAGEVLAEPLFRSTDVDQCGCLGKHRVTSR
jgi:hypothetical protein